MICNICFGILRGQVGRRYRGSFDLIFDHQATLGSLKQSADMACCICRRIWEDIMNMPITDNSLKLSSLYSREKGAFVSAHISIMKNRQDAYRLDFTLSRASTVKNCIGTLLLRRMANKSETFMYTAQSHSLDSPEVLNLANSWIEKCRGLDHKYCPGGSSQLPPTKGVIDVEPNPPYFPTRLIELRPGDSYDADSPTVKLIVTRNATHRNEQNLIKPQGHYVTLSHCWGKNANPFCLVANNLHIFQKNGIPLKELPKTFKDAIHFAHRLAGVRYIWIDSLCIIQKDEADWLHESTQMYQVYRNSYCNISATAAKDGSHGLYTERDPQHLWEEDVNFNTEDMLRVKKGEGPRGNAALIQRCSITDPSLWARKVDAAPVNTRAWVLQERLLSPRVLHFCEDQIAWECRELDASESASAGIESLELTSGVIRDRVRLKSLVAVEYGPKDFSGDEADVASKAHDNWKRIIERYSLTNLTNPRDKLIALAGIAEEMATQIGAPYIAGMWRNKYFASQLLWCVETQYKNGKFLYPSRRPKCYRAPTFSWAAIDAPQGIRCGDTKEEKDLLITITQLEVQPQPQVDNSQFGLVKEGGFIKLECQRLPIVIDRKARRTADGQEDIYTWALTGERYGTDEKVHPNVHLDSPKDDFEDFHSGHSSMWLVPAYKDSSGEIICLLLHKTGDSDHFRRVGLSMVRYVSFEVIFQHETLTERNGYFKGVKKEIIQII
ncbi:hypothetical protein G7Y89_g5514 [Cudoniella acicularis]|uniref:Heterokaryon incompatibility domain-containing protein n=1 Tax=Cudoniella acicularis TaxID=354080 RepID=A0A8H4RMB9_9HELO|nr:hypothetical protein G7Y89_g5514 [Cudoniella acicularis]